MSSTPVEQIKERLDIAEVISSYIKLDKAGVNFKAKCPFHNEKTPSFFVSAARQSFYCFGCQAKGDMFSFVEKFEGVDFKGALEVLAKRAGVELKKFQSEEAIEERDKIFDALEEATKIYARDLSRNENALSYLIGRGLKKDTISEWQIGYADPEWRSLHDELLQKGFSRENMLEAGLIKKVPGEEKYYDTFRNRIMFPISDNSSRVIAFSGRLLGEDPKAPKYLNSPETKLFYKSEVLYGFHVAKSHIRKLDYAVLVEGQMDLVMSHQTGVGNTVASSGTALTSLHLQKLLKLSNRVIIAYDADDSGEKAARKAAVLALSLGMEVKIASLPQGEDPASVIRKDPEGWKDALKKSIHFADFIISKAFRENSGHNLTKEIIGNVLPVIAIIKSDIEKSQFVKKISLKLGVDEESVRNDLKKVERLLKDPKPEDGRGAPSNVISVADMRTNTLERIMAGIVFLEESSQDENMGFRRRWVAIEEEEAEAAIAKFEEEKEALIFETEKYGDKGKIDEVAEDILRRIEIKHLKKKLQRAAVELDDASLKEDEEKKARSDLEKIQKRLKELGS